MSLETGYDVGSMDRRVLLQVGTESVATNGERQSTWSNYGWRWADMASMSATESVSGDMLMVSTSATFRLHYDANVNEKYRLIYRNRIFNISGVNEVGRHQYMDLICEAGDMIESFTADSTQWTADSTTITADMTMY